jgi:phage terminase large subunit
MTREEMARALLARWNDNPVAFAHEAIGVRTWSKQDEILRAIARSSRVAVRSGHKIGKSHSAAIVAHWWVSTRPGGLVVMTSATARQVQEILWKEFRGLHRTSRVPLGPRPALQPSTGYRLADGRAVFGFSTKEPERMAGISGSNLLFIVDEASGVPEQIFEAIEGNRAGGARLLMFSNPTRTSGYFFDAFHTKAEFFERIAVSSRSTPNVVERRRVIPGLATFEWIEEKIHEWGESSPIFQVRVEGNFPSQSPDSVIPFGLLQAAIERYDETTASGLLHIGVDPARFGDDESTVCPRRGKLVFPIEAFQGLDGVQLGGKVLEVVRKRRLSEHERPRVKVDTIGVGASVA